MTAPLWRRRLPFVLGALLAGFLVLFSFDVFGTGSAVSEELVGFLIHNLPSVAIVVGLFVARRDARWGAWFFLALAVASLLLFDNPAGRLITSLPLAVIGGLFLWNAHTAT